MTELKPAPRAPIVKRAALVLALWLGFWILALGLVAGLLWVPFAQFAYRSSVELSGGIAGLAGLTLAYSLRPRRRDGDAAKDIHPLSRETAQPLYALVERIGAELGIGAPVNIHLISQSSAFIYGKRGLFGTVKSLEVALGLPLIGSMTEPELGSVIAHEFGHFVAGDLSLGPWVYRTRNAIARTVTDLDGSMFFLDLLFRTYGQWFLRMSASVSRAQEFAADATAAKAFGSAATCNALNKVHLLDPAWSSYFHLELVPALGRGARLPIFDGFRRFCKAASRRTEVQEAIRKAEQQAVSEYDTHPSLEERLAALMPGAKPSYLPLADCFSLLGGEAATEQAWYSLFPAEDVVECVWPRFGQDVLQARIAARFAGSWMDPDELPLAELVPMASGLDELWPRMRPDGVSFLSRQGKRNHMKAVLTEWIIACLVKRGYTATLDPGQALRMERDGLAVEPSALLDAALAATLSVEHLARFEPAATGATAGECL